MNHDLSRLEAIRLLLLKAEEEENTLARSKKAGWLQRLRAAWTGKGQMESSGVGVGKTAS